jgi:hypothetical protein
MKGTMKDIKASWDVIERERSVWRGGGVSVERGGGKREW